MLKKIFCISSMSVLIFAYSANNYYLHIRNQMNKNMNISSANDGIIKTKKQKLDTYLDTTVYSDIKLNKNSNIIQSANKSSFLFNNVKYQINAYNQYKRSIYNNKKASTDNILNVRGYCRVLNTVKVFASDQFGELSCDLQDIKTKKDLTAKIFVKFMPDYKREMLIAFPIYANLLSKRYDATGYFLNATKTSLNVADRINGVVIKKLLLKGMLVESDIAYNQAMSYMNALQNAQTSTQVAYIGNNNNTIPVQSSQTQKPKVKNYINTGIVQGIAAIIHLLGENSLYKLRPLFYVNKGDIFYTEMILKNQNVFNKMQGVMKNKIEQINKNNAEYQKNLTSFSTEKFIQSQGSK